MIEKIATDKAPKAIGPYAQAVTAGGFLFTSGQIALDPETGILTGNDVTEQTERILQNLAEVLKAAGCGFDDVVKTTCFLADMKDFAAFNEVYARYFTACPARSCVEVSALPKGALAEVEAVARIPER